MGRKKLPDGVVRTEQIQLRVSGPFKEWLARYAEFKGETLSAIIVRLLIGAARRDGFEPPPR